MFDIHVIAVNQQANPIRDWAVKIVGQDEPLAMIHRRVDDDKYQISKEYDSGLFDSLTDARNYIDLQLNLQMARMN